ncbi:MAG TPA: sensor histidine kinase [Actinomycetota bacterium]|jgi:signal transduction histidine kinase|nr:sensor histidine kinase [Actinomycetota bacterium]
MSHTKIYSWTVFCSAMAIFFGLFARSDVHPELTTLAFWTVLLAAIELLPVSLGFGTEVTMAFPIHLAVAITFGHEPWIPMLIAGIGAVDLREIRREIPLHRALFNRAQTMLSVGAATLPFAVSPYQGPSQLLHSGPGMIAGLVAASAVLHMATNLTLVVLAVRLQTGTPMARAYRSLVPDPVTGFAVSYLVLTTLGAVTAFAYTEVSWGALAVIAVLVPLIFARLSIQGARAQQELSERLQRQQESLLRATEKVFEERELERKRIAEQIHDSALQMLAAASYGCANAHAFFRAGRLDQAEEAVGAARDAVEGAMAELRRSLVDLRKSSVEEGGLMETIHNFADQLSTLWGTNVKILGEIANEPPIPVALAAFQILQEGLANALKHAQTHNITVQIEESDGMVHILVEDDGQGFDPQAAVGSEHVGMRLMRERAQQVGGRIELDTAPGEGTRLRAVFPAGIAQ